MELTRRRIALLAGAGLLVLGVGLIYAPAALILAGALLLALTVQVRP